jgi:hypothetical protein
MTLTAAPMTVPRESGHRAAMAESDNELPTIADLDALVRLIEETPEPEQLYVRWSRGPALDLCHEDPDRQMSRDSLTGVPLPGLSANPLAVESWWDGRPLRLWVARRLYDYRHLRDLRGPGTRAWVLAGEVCGRGPDNEPLVRCHRPIAWIADRALREARNLVDALSSAEWGPLDRRGGP